MNWDWTRLQEVNPQALRAGSQAVLVEDAIGLPAGTLCNVHGIKEEPRIRIEIVSLPDGEVVGSIVPLVPIHKLRLASVTDSSVAACKDLRSLVKLIWAQGFVIGRTGRFSAAEMCEAIVAAVKDPSTDTEYAVTRANGLRMKAVELSRLTTRTVADWLLLCADGCDATTSVMGKKMWPVNDWPADRWNDVVDRDTAEGLLLRCTMSTDMEPGRFIQAFVDTDLSIGC